ncbi:MAG TPA: VOC family protein [Chthoniobacteraceae bacterium]|nr:VOC family protein [Chthoniobacteraceae bacterium]
MTTPASSAVKSIPDGYPILAPYLAIRDAANAIEFYKKAFGATERSRMADPGGKVMHAEIEVSGGLIMLCDEFPEWGMLSPQQLGGSPIVLHVYVPDVDATFKQAEAAGCTIVMPPKDQFYGDRSGRLTDPYGHIWSFATHVEDVTPDEMDRRFKEMCK